ncbi:hypothetical protein [Myroides odoratimimus]|uniref:hypothetical protein n=1 Tax=Myroides odoratimimus TaxID=76832 RepID=UPI000920EFF8|nr:hypothetical protein [Myroides odoratimimus]MDM1519940.1 hypothetical protein [Myroides odoratimimus]SHM29875.1 hypothetical protein SAMN05444275_11180 [Myroides odoratimimus subsp. xuanwuensis]
MGMISCSKHGLSGILSCMGQDLVDKIQLGEEVLSTSLCKIKVVMHIDIEDKLEFSYVLSLETKDRLKLADRYEISKDEDLTSLDSLYKSLGIICVRCFAEYQYKDAFKGFLIGAEVL